MKQLCTRGLTSNTAFVFLPDSASTVGAGKTGLTNASAGLLIGMRRDKSSTVTAYSGANIGAIATLGTWVDPTAGKINFKEVDATNMPGVYELHFVDLLFNTSDTSRKILGMVTATGTAPAPFEIQLSAIDIQSASAFMTGVNGLAPPTNWNFQSIDASGRVDVGKVGGTAQTARDLGASVLLSSGTGAGQLSLAAGLVSLSSPQAFNNTGQTTKQAATLATADVTGNLPANVAQIAGQTATAAAGVTFPASIGTSTFAAGQNVGAAASVTAGVTVTTNNDKSGYSLVSPQAFNNTGQTTKNAVTLAAADVTGNLPANVAQIAGQTASAAAGVTFPASIGTSTFAAGQNVGAAASVTAAVTVGTDSANQIASQTAVTAIKAKTDLIATNTGDSPNAVTAQAAVTTIAANVLLLLGINGQFQGCRNFVYTGTNLTSYDICIYSSNANATTNDGVTGLVHKFSAALTYNGSNLQITQVITQIS